MKRFIQVAQLCFEWKNYNSCLEIVGGLSMHVVLRLKKAWKALPQKYQQMWDSINLVMSPRQNYLALRKHMKTVESPALPYFGLYLSDLTYVCEKYPTRVAGGRLINVAKMRMFADIIVEMQHFQATSKYPFSDNPPLRRYLAGVPASDDDELYAASKVAEPSEGSELSMSPSGSLLRLGRRLSMRSASSDKINQAGVGGGDSRTMKGLKDFEKVMQ